MQEEEDDDVIHLTRSQQEFLLHKYAALERAIEPKDDCIIGAGYTNCIDMGFQAVDLFQALRPQIAELEAARGGKRLKPKIHSKIKDLKSFVETFLHFFQLGSNAEFTMNKELY